MHLVARNRPGEPPFDVSSIAAGPRGQAIPVDVFPGRRSGHGGLSTTRVAGNRFLIPAQAPWDKPQPERLWWDVAGHRFLTGAALIEMTSPQSTPLGYFTWAWTILVTPDPPGAMRMGRNRMVASVGDHVALARRLEALRSMPARGRSHITRRIKRMESQREDKKSSVFI